MPDDDTIPYGSGPYWILLALLFFGRGMDILSTWMATPNLVHEGNPIARKLGWKWGSILNLVICFTVALWPLPAIAFVTTSLLVAAHNFKSAWMMRTLGEVGYGRLMNDLMEQTSLRVYIYGLMGETVLTMLVGGTLIFFCFDELIPMAIGLGIVAFGGAVAFYTVPSVWRMRHRMR